MAKKKINPSSAEPVIENRKARHAYEITETLEVGIKLHGSEVKAVRSGLISLGEGYVSATEIPPTLTLHSVNIGEYQPAGALMHAAVRQRTLLAHKREIVKLARQMQTKGVTIVPLKLYFKNGYAKLLIGLGTGKTSFDKRESIKEREHERDIARAMSRRA
ncbi:MAG: SsrA-binding protein SmpB [Phycisphaerales bacterium]|nr:MAG: SsrA-binding protein SmpB [Phycisphaerales bacterium]